MKMKTLGTGRRRVGGGICRGVSRIVVVVYVQSFGIGLVALENHFLGKKIHRFAFDGWFACCTSLGSKCNGAGIVVVAVVVDLVVAPRSCLSHYFPRKCQQQRKRVGVGLVVGASVPWGRKCKSSRESPWVVLLAQFDRWPC